MAKNVNRHPESSAFLRRPGGAALDLAASVGSLPAAPPGPAALAERPSSAVHGLPSHADAAAAQLLLAPDLPADDRPQSGQRVLLAGLVWGGTTLIELEQVPQGGDLPARHLFDLPGARLPGGFRLVRHAADELVVTVPDGWATRVHGAGAARSFEQLRAAGHAQLVEAPFRGTAYTLQGSDRVVVQVAPQVELVLRYVRAAPSPRKGFFASLDAGFAGSLFAALLTAAIFAFLAHLAPKAPPPADDDLWRAQARTTRFLATPAPVREAPKTPDVAGATEGAKASGGEGKVGQPEVKKRAAAASKKGAKETEASKAARDRKLVMRKGLLAALRKLGATGGGAAASVLGPGGLGTGINSALGGVKVRAQAGEASGLAGLGTRGAGAGGGGKALGIGGLGTVGGGRGRGGYGDVDLGGRGKQETEFIPGKTTVVGGLSRDLINRVIQRHYNEIKYCYEKELTKNPSLYGKVSVLFVIDGGGKVSDALVQQTTLGSEPVESCMVNHVRRWAFPQPEGGGTVEVTYPYVFKASGP